MCDYEKYSYMTTKNEDDRAITKDFTKNIPNIDILLTFSQIFSRKCNENYIFPGVGVPHDG